MRPGIIVDVTAADRGRLEAIVADRNSPQNQVWRAAICIPPVGLSITHICHEGLARCVVGAGHDSLSGTEGWQVRCPWTPQQHRGEKTSLPDALSRTCAWGSVCAS